MVIWFVTKFIAKLSTCRSHTNDEKNFKHALLENQQTYYVLSLGKQTQPPEAHAQALMFSLLIDLCRIQYQFPNQGLTNDYITISFNSDWMMYPLYSQKESLSTRKQFSLLYIKTIKLNMCSTVAPWKPMVSLSSLPHPILSVGSHSTFLHNDYLFLISAVEANEADVLHTYMIC